VELYLALQKLERLRKRAPRRVQILRDGDIGIEGWPEDMRLTPTVAAHIIEHFERMGNKVPIDYNHATTAVEDGDTAEAPAAGFITDLEYVMGDGLYGYVEWNAEGRGDVEGQAYKYLSPVVQREKGDKKANEKWRLHSIALTNRPATREQRELLAASLRAEESEIDMPKKTTRKKVAKKGTYKANDPVLEEVSTDPEVAPEVADKVEDVNDGLEGLAEALRAAGQDVPDDYAAEDLIALATQVVAGMSAPEEEAEVPETAEAADTPNESTLAAQVKVMAGAIKSMSTELAQIKSERQQTAVDRMIEEQVEANKINPNDESQMHAAKLLAESDEELFKATYDSIPAYVEPGTLTGGTVTATKGAREKLIAEAVSEWKSNEFNQGGPLDGYVNIVLDEHEQANLSKEEAAKLRS
jgi:phage I-like protein